MTPDDSGCGGEFGYRMEDKPNKLPKFWFSFRKITDRIVFKSKTQVFTSGPTITITQNGAGWRTGRSCGDIIMYILLQKPLNSKENKI